ncbi:MAG TPA: SDR family NAD(P)-dependent oxidoreductase [Propionibacteriaceae bacterium]|nr:SDR family NAD(P)-dependent oxidoreductase [Propionibacteriaceae bacterium]
MRILIAGASSPLGVASAAALTRAGHEVIAVGTDQARLASVGAAHRMVCDLIDPAAVHDLAENVGPLDGLVHLVGGWRGGGGLEGQSDEDYRWLEARIVTTLRNTTRAFLPALRSSSAGRVAIVSTTGLAGPTAGNANYLASKAAAEAWLAAVGHALRDSPATVHVERVRALVSAAERVRNPERDFSRHTDVDDLASRFVALFGPDL